MLIPTSSIFLFLSSVDSSNFPTIPCLFSAIKASDETAEDASVEKSMTWLDDVMHKLQFAATKETALHT